MASQQEKASCVLRFEVSRSVITVQREFRARFRTTGSFTGALLVTVTIVSFDALALLRHTRMMHVMLNQIWVCLVILTASLGKWNKKKLPMRSEEGSTTCPIMSLFTVNMQYNSSTMHVAVKLSTVTAVVTLIPNHSFRSPANYLAATA
jgi:hypothetical protein